ncbi:terminase small subunit [Patescibacteria group bacterium]
MSNEKIKPKTKKTTTRSKALSLVRERREIKKIEKSNEKFLNKIKDKGLRPEWKMFIDEYLLNGFNATNAYAKAYNCDSKVANKNAYRLMVNDGIREEIEYRLESQRITDDGILVNLWDIARERNEKTVKAAVSALDILAKCKGLIKEGEKNNQFFTDNVAVFQPITSADENREFEDMIKRSGRVIE